MFANAVSYSSDDYEEEVFVNEQFMLECRVQTEGIVHRILVVDQMSGKHLSRSSIKDTRRPAALDYAKAIIGLKS